MPYINLESTPQLKALKEQLSKIDTWSEALQQTDHRATLPQWLFANKDRILELQSSKIWRKDSPLQMYCDSCERYFKHCMFSHKQRKRDITICNWCAYECDRCDEKDFNVLHHIHCNRHGKKRCGFHGSLVPPPDDKLMVTQKEASIEDVPAPELQFVVREKMSQKERKAAAAAALIESD